MAGAGGVDKSSRHVVSDSHGAIDAGRADQRQSQPHRQQSGRLKLQRVETGDVGDKISRLSFEGVQRTRC